MHGPMRNPQCRFWQAAAASAARARLCLGSSLRTVNFDDQDWDQAQGHADVARTGNQAWKLGFAVALGMVLGAVLVYALGRPPAPAAAVPAAQSIDRALRIAEPPNGAVRAPLPPSAGEAAASQALRDVPAKDTQAAPPAAAEPALRAPTARRDVDTGPDAAERAAQRAHERKERAWAALYKKPSHCDENPSKDTLVECANHYIRARRQFEQGQAYGPH